MNAMTVVPIPGIPEIHPGADIAGEVARALCERGLALMEGDIIVLKSKIVSKAEGRLVRAEDIEPSAFAMSAAALTGREPRYMELVLRESVRIVRMGPGVIISETKHGFVFANAGVDGSNAGKGIYALLPENPDASAANIRAGLLDAFGVNAAVIISDTFGRPWREGQCDLAIGLSGMAALRDDTGAKDAFGNVLRYTKAAAADELASAAELVCGKTSGIPAALIRGYALDAREGAIDELIMPKERDLFR